MKFISGMCLLKVMQEKIETGVPQPRHVHGMKIFSIVFIVLGAFIFGLTLSQAIMKDVQGVKADKSNYTCSS